MAYFPWPEYVKTDSSVQLCAAIPNCSSLSSKGSPVLPLEQPIRYIWEFKCSEYPTVEFSASVTLGPHLVFDFSKLEHQMAEVSWKPEMPPFSLRAKAHQPTEHKLLTFKSENTKHSLSPTDNLRACFKSMHIPQERLGVHGFSYINCWLSNKKDSTDVSLND